MKTPWRGCVHLEDAFHSEGKMDDLKKKGAADRNQINMNEAWEVDYWTNELGVSKGELAKVVEKVGNSTAAVCRELGLLGTSH
jgi:hypothetical protein